MSLLGSDIPGIDPVSLVEAVKWVHVVLSAHDLRFGLRF
jgi:hypothetical protein